MSAEPTYLVADIGGTNARFAIARGDTGRGFELDQVRRLKARDHATLGDAARAYLEGCTGARPARACFAVAGPVEPGTIRLTNSGWELQPDELARELGLEDLLPVNDFAAQARGAPLVAESETVPVRVGSGMPGAPCAVLGPGTGLGLGLLVPTQGGITVVATEGGHAGFAPRSEEEAAVGRIIAQETGFASWETLLSGVGLVNIHRALCQLAGEPPPEHRAADITREALEDPSSMSRRVVELFCGVLGAFAGDVAVMSGARGGVYLGGGIVPRIRTLLDGSPFEARFTERGPMSDYAAAIPVRLLLSDTTALLGAAALAEGQGA